MKFTEFIKESNLKEGVWSFDPAGALKIKKILEKQIKEWYDIVGDDIFMDGLQNSISRIDELIEMSKKQK